MDYVLHNNEISSLIIIQNCKVCSGIQRAYLLVSQNMKIKTQDLGCIRIIQTATYIDKRINAVIISSDSCRQRFIAFKY